METSLLFAILFLVTVTAIGFGVWSVHFVLNRHQEWWKKEVKEKNIMIILQEEQKNNFNPKVSERNPVKEERHGGTCEPYNPAKENFDVICIEEVDFLKLWELMVQLRKTEYKAVVMDNNGSIGTLIEGGYVYSNNLELGKPLVINVIDHLYLFIPRNSEIPKYVWLGFTNIKGEKVAGEYLKLN